MMLAWACLRALAKEEALSAKWVMDIIWQDYGEWDTLLFHVLAHTVYPLLPPCPSAQLITVHSLASDDPSEWASRIGSADDHILSTPRQPSSPAVTSSTT